MKTTIRLAMTSMLAAAVLLGATGALAATSYKYNVVLKPIPIKNSKGTPVATGAGSASVTLYPVRRQVCWSITVHGIKLPAKSATLATSSGSTVATLSAPASTGKSAGCTRRGITRSTINAIHSKSNHYWMKITGSNGKAVLRGTL